MIDKKTQKTTLRENWYEMIYVQPSQTNKLTTLL